MKAKHILTAAAVMLTLMCAGCGDEFSDVSRTEAQTTEHFTIFTAEGADSDSAALTAEGLEKQYSRISAYTGIEADERIPVTLFASQESFADAAGYDEKNVFSGHTRKKGVYMVAPDHAEGYTADNILQVATADMTGYMIKCRNPKAKPYISVGLSCYEAAMSYVLPEDVSGSLMSLKELEKLPEDETARIAASAYTFAEYIIKTRGYDVMLKIIDGTSLEKALGLSREEIEAEWHGYVEKTYPTMTLSAGTAHFDVYCTETDAAAAKEIADTLEGGYADIAAFFGKEPQKTSVRIYPDKESLDASKRDFFNQGGGLTSGYVDSPTQMHLLSPQSPDVKYHKEHIVSSLPLHEFVHVMSWQTVGNYIKMPAFMSEGIAQYLTGDDSYVKVVLVPLLRQGTFPDIKTLWGMTYKDGNIYQIGYAFCEYIDSVWGGDTLLKVLKAPESMYDTLGMSENEFYNAWTAYMREKYY